MLRRPVVRVFLLFLIPMMVPLLILGSLNLNLVSGIMTDYAEASTTSELGHIRSNLDILFQELDAVSLLIDDTQSTVPVFETLFQTDRLGLEELNALRLLTGVLTTLSLSKPYIHSVILYYRNDRGLYYSTDTGRTPIGDAESQTWYREYQTRDQDHPYWVTVVRAAGTSGQRLVQIGKILSYKEGMVALNLNPGSVERLFGDWKVLPRQRLSVVDSQGTTLFRNAAAKEAEDRTAGPLPGEPYKKTVLPLERLGLSLVSLVPEAELYRAPLGSLQITALLLVLTFAVGSMLTFTLVRYNYSYVKTISAILDSYSRGVPMPRLEEKTHDLYGGMIQDILSAFMEKEYLAGRTRLLELEARQAQLNPHFLFNTLKTIYWRSMGLTGRENPVSHLIEDLSELLSFALAEPGQLVRLEQEVQASRAYLKIQAVRYGEAFRFRWSVPQSLGSAAVPRLILQPLLENCFSHAPREDGPVAVTVRIRTRRTDLEIQVADRGPGLAPERLEALRAKMGLRGGGEGIGLSNTADRLRLTFGSRTVIRVRSRPGSGFAVRIRFPWAR